MAIKNLPSQGPPSAGGLSLTYYDSTAGTPVAERLTTGTLATGDQFDIPNNGETVLLFKNGAAPTIDVVIESKATFGGLAVADRTVVVPANSDFMVGPFAINVYGDTLRIAIETVANTELAVLRTSS